MPEILQYDRSKAVAYAERWALSRNPKYYNFDSIGGDCTNFASQCIYAGAGVMNYTPVTGWFYRSTNDRTASWTGVEFLYKFLINNRGIGPFAEQLALDMAQTGDIVQLGTADGHFYHSPVVVSTLGGIYVAAHTYDAINKPLGSYMFDQVRLLHIVGVRK